MKALILAAGMGTRLGKYTENLPKGMLPFNGKALIEWQIQQYKSIGINDINIVTGYMKDKIPYKGVKYFHNPAFATTNMVESMMCAREILNGNLIVSYSDILFTPALGNLMINSTDDIGVAVDRSWRNYWQKRYGTTEDDLESLTIEGDQITEIGRPVESSNGLDHRYIGMVRFSSDGIAAALDIYDGKYERDESWIQSGKSFKNGYMTDLLNELIINGHKVSPIVSDGGWLEFDTVGDYEVMLELFEKNEIDGAFFK